MANVLLAIMGWEPKPWEERFRALAPQHTLHLWPEQLGDPAEIRYACVWNVPPGVLAGFPNLKAIFSLGAGVDNLLADPKLPDVPVVRVVDNDLTIRMTEYVVLHVLMHHRRQLLYEAQQRDRIWRDHEQPAATDVSVGIMGLGVLGSHAAFGLHRLGFKVAGWSRTPKALVGIDCFHGLDALEPFLRRSEILVCLLPATPATRGIINLDLLRKLKRNGALGGAHLINAARGSLQVDDDILAALEEDTLAGATLDVFSNEPLPLSSPFWFHPKVVVTPHNAAQPSPQTVVINIVLQIDRIEYGIPVENVIDPELGY